VRLEGLLNSHDKVAAGNKQIPDACAISVILSTLSVGIPKYQHPERIKSLIPKGLTSEIIVVHYGYYNARSGNSMQEKSIESNNIETTDISEINNQKNYQKVVHVNVDGEFASAIIKGVELSKGQFILAVDADVDYPEEVISELIKNLMDSPNSIIIASRYSKGVGKQRLPSIRSTISKGARIIVRHGLNVKDVRDPLSGCFAFPRQVIEDVKIEGKGNELLLEILVKINNRNSNITIKEIPFREKDMKGTKKLDFDRIKSYSKAVWHLYCYGRKSDQLQNDRYAVEQKRHKSVLFLSKAARFFTVGASGLVVNYVVSFLLSNVVSNIWYIQATLFGILTSITTNFLLNKVWTFEDHDFSIRHFFRQYILFLTLCALGAGVQLSLVFIFVEYFHIQYAISLIIAVCIASLGNFLLNKKITFGEKIWE
jgi:dolichol-phosphate mannosyltransferase